MEKVVPVSPVSPQPILKPQQPVLRKFQAPKSGGKAKQVGVLVVIGIFVVMAGVGTGKILAQNINGESETTAPKGIAIGDTKAGSDGEVGIETENSQSEEGILKEGGKDGDGSFHLDRNLGEDKNIYLTSTVIDLQRYVGKKVRITGETISGQKAGWLMDVTKIKVIE